MDRLILVLLFCISAFGSNPGSVAIRDTAGNFVSLTDSSLNVNITNDTVPTKITSPLESNGGIPVNVQDQTSIAFDIPFTKTLDTCYSIIQPIPKGSYSIVVSSGHIISAGNILFVVDSVAPWVYFGEVLSVDVDTIELDRALTDTFAVPNTYVCCATDNLAVDGSVTRQEFVFAPPTPVELDVTRIMFQMITTNAVVIDNFGDIVGGLTRGLTFSINDGFAENYWNVKTNGDLILLMYDIEFYDSIKKGSNGLGGRLTYGGQNKHGVVIRVGDGDTLKLTIQDDLSTILSFKVLAAGHVTTD